MCSLERVSGGGRHLGPSVRVDFFLNLQALGAKALEGGIAHELIKKLRTDGRGPQGGVGGWVGAGGGEEGHAHSMRGVSRPLMDSSQTSLVAAPASRSGTCTRAVPWCQEPERIQRRPKHTHTHTRTRGRSSSASWARLAACHSSAARLAACDWRVCALLLSSNTRRCAHPVRTRCSVQEGCE